ncbi:MAG: D-alanine--D-alanine ligase family protein [Chloroflexota bacterium]|nr:D-alanine--D-alanine ligase family protein [Chloroflexota bacterium]
MSQGKQRVGIVFGGRSGEHEVSLQSAQSVMEAIDTARFEVVPIAIDKQGHWLVGEASRRFLATTMPANSDAGDRAVVSSAEVQTGLVPKAESLRDIDVVFPVLHGPLGEDGTVQGLFELADLPYVGCGVAASAVAMDKALCKDIFAARGFLQAAFLVVKRRDWRDDPRLVMETIENRLGFPVFVKPANLGSSVGINKASERANLASAIEDAARYDRKLVVEKVVPAARELEVSVLGNDAPIASLPGEVVPCHEFYDYAAKYIEPDSELIIPAPISDDLTVHIRQLAIDAFQAIDGAGMARVDFLLDGETGDLYLNEVNTIPGFTGISMYPKLWQASGLPYPELIDRLIDLALERYADKSSSETSYRPKG